jgi:excisionase family DNA binding protein
MTDRDLYSIEEARQRLGGISRDTVYLWLRSGKLPSVVVGCRRFIAAAAIADLIAASTTITSPKPGFRAGS